MQSVAHARSVLQRVERLRLAGRVIAVLGVLVVVASLVTTPVLALVGVLLVSAGVTGSLLGHRKRDSAVAAYRDAVADAAIDEPGNALDSTPAILRGAAESVGRDPDRASRFVSAITALAAEDPEHVGATTLSLSNADPDSLSTALSRAGGRLSGPIPPLIASVARARDDPSVVPDADDAVVRQIATATLEDYRGRLLAAAERTADNADEHAAAGRYGEAFDTFGRATELADAAVELAARDGPAVEATAKKQKRALGERVVDAVVQLVDRQLSAVEVESDPAFAAREFGSLRDTIAGLERQCRTYGVARADDLRDLRWETRECQVRAILAAGDVDEAVDALLPVLANDGREEWKRVVVTFRRLIDEYPDTGHAVVRELANHLDKGRYVHGITQVLADLAEHHPAIVTDDIGTAVLSAVDDDRPAVRRNACLVLGVVESRGALEALGDAKDDPNFQVRAAAKQAMGGRSPRESGR